MYNDSQMEQDMPQCKLIEHFNPYENESDRKYTDMAFVELAMSNSKRRFGFTSVSKRDFKKMLLKMDIEYMVLSIHSTIVIAEMLNIPGISILYNMEPWWNGLTKAIVLDGMSNDEILLVNGKEEYFVIYGMGVHSVDDSIK